ncbi:uncharacterized protein LOC108099737 isoform X2 [Drosophila ficusphila]|nr:uncharacterized protein LOC108099737 isoform X2 [Drosophila ficusphila]
MPNLKKFTCKGNLHVKEVYHIQKMVALEELRIHFHCLGKIYLPLNIFEICAPLTNLHSLRVNSIIIWPSEKPHSMVCPELEHLEMNNSEIFTELPNCPKLKTLHMISSKCHIEGLVFGFLQRNGEKIEEIKEDCNPPLFDGDSFLQVLRSCKKLRAFYTQMRDIETNQAYVSSIVDVLRENCAKQEEPFRLFICSREKWKSLRPLIPRNSILELNSF